jgi:hypothetical protein
MTAITSVPLPTSGEMPDTPSASGSSSRSAEICSVCISEVAEELIRTTCDHTYHKDCLDTWLNQRNTCPDCRHRNPLNRPEAAHRARLAESFDSLPFAELGMRPRERHENNEGAEMRAVAGSICTFGYCILGCGFLIPGVVMMAINGSRCSNDDDQCDDLLGTAGVGLVATGVSVIGYGSYCVLASCTFFARAGITRRN